MENASKALLMAGGMLIALLIIGALLLVFNQIGDYEKAQTSNEKASQVADFNKEFIRFVDDVHGYDLITVINKVIDFNKKDGSTGNEKDIGNSVDYSKKITVKITNMNTFKKDIGVNGKSALLSGNRDTYTEPGENKELIEAINKFSTMEKQYTLGAMSKLSANYDAIESGDKSIQDVIGKKIDISTDDIAKYREYSEFKSATFKGSDTKYDGDQIVELTFEYVKLN